MWNWLFRRTDEPRVVVIDETVAELTDEEMEIAAAILNAAECKRIWTLHSDPLRPRRCGGLLAMGLWAQTGSHGYLVFSGYGRTWREALMGLLRLVDEPEWFRRTGTERKVSSAPPRAA